MRNNRNDNDIRRAGLFVTACERGVARQRQLIDKLIAKGRSTKQAKEVLATMEKTLLEMRNYREVLESLKGLKEP
jgi:hypothetical protein